MGIGDLMMEIHTPVLLEELIPLTVILEQDDLKVISKDLLEKITSSLNVTNEDVFMKERDLFVIKNRIPYLTDLSIWISNYEDFIKDEIKRCEYFFAMCDSLIKSKKFDEIYSSLLAAGYSKISLLFYQLWKEEMTYEERFQYIKELYIDNDYGFSQFLIEEFLLLLRSQKAERVWEAELKPLAKKGYITVYRGEEDKSTKSERAISWTTSFKTAIFFASRYTIDGRLIKGKVKLEDVLFYTDQRNEKEIISEKVFDIEEIEQYSTKNMISKITDTPITSKASFSYIELYNSFKAFLTPDLFTNPEGHHGTLHSKRVLLLSITMACLENIQDQELLALCDISAFHDIGRENEWEDPNHGVKSWNKVIEKNLLQSSKKDYIEIVKFVISVHDKGDKIAKKQLRNNFSIKNKPLALKLYNIVCDADALDRVRFDDLNPSYLRTEVAKKLIVYAKSCLHYVKDK